MKEVTITITVQGDTDRDLYEAFNEAVRKINNGFTSGWDGNPNGNYRFEVGKTTLKPAFLT